MLGAIFAPTKGAGETWAGRRRRRLLPVYWPCRAVLVATPAGRFSRTCRRFREIPIGSAPPQSNSRALETKCEKPGVVFPQRRPQSRMNGVPRAAGGHLA